MAEMTRDEEAAFAAMQQATTTPPAEPAERTEALEDAEATPALEEPEVAESESEAGEGEKKRRGLVPHGAFHEERTRRQELEAENRRLYEERARFDERLRVIQEMNQPAAPQEPDETTDPIGTISHLRQRLARLEQGGQQWNAEQQAQAQVAQLASAADQDARAFRQNTPDYGSAYEFWIQNRAAELQAYGMPNNQIPETLNREQLQIAANAFQRGVSAAETLYNVAKQRGWRNGAAAAPGGGPGGGSKDAASEQIERVSNGQQRSQTLSGTGGGASTTEMTANRLLAMSNEEFDAWTTKNPAKTARLMGREPPRKRG